MVKLYTYAKTTQYTRPAVCLFMLYSVLLEKIISEVCNGVNLFIQPNVNILL